MRRGRVFFLLAFVVILGLVAVVFFWQRNMQPGATATTSPETTPTPVVNLVDVVVITQRVPRGRVLDESVLSTIKWQQDLLLEGMYSDVGEVVGRQAKFDLDSGIPLTSGMLVDSAEELSATGSNAALLIPRGMVAVSIPINRLSSVSYAPQTGDHVNVIVTVQYVDLDENFQTILPNKTGVVIGPGLEPAALTVDVGGVQGQAIVDPILGQTIYVIPSELQRPRMTSQTLLQDVMVLKMGDFPQEEQVGAEPTPTPVAEGQTEENTGEAQPTEEPPPPDVITLIVRPQDAVTLNYLIFSGGQLTLALRPAGDDSRVQTDAVTLQFLMDQYRIPLPVKLPYGMHPPVNQVKSPELPNDQPAEPAP